MITPKAAFRPALYALFVITLLLCICLEPLTAQQRVVSGLMFNVDDAYFFTAQDPKTVSGKDIDKMVDFYADMGVREFVCNVSGQLTNYDSKVWQSFWEGYDPEGPDDQPYLSGLLPEDLPSYRKRLDTFLAIHRQGVEYPARIVRRCRERDMSVWLSVRMNDSHGLEKSAHPGVSHFIRENVHLRRVSYQRFNRADGALDFVHEEVRDKYLALVQEVTQRYDMDGLELDFCRHPAFFGIGRELDGSRLMTEFVGKVYTLVEAAARRRGHPIHFGIRIPSQPETARNIGLDVMDWVERGWIDLVVVNGSGVATSTDFNMPIRLWRDLLEPYGVALAGCSEASVAACHRAGLQGAQVKPIDPAMLTGAATAFLHGGSDAVYLFNMFLRFSRPEWTDDVVRETLTAMNSLEALDELHRRHVLTYREITAPGELIMRPPIMSPGELSFVDAALPARGKYGIFRLQTGPKPVDRKVQVVLETRGCRSSEISIRVNGVPCDLATKEADGDRLLFDVPEHARTDEAHVIEVYANLVVGPPFTIVWVEIDIAAKEK